MKPLSSDVLSLLRQRYFEPGETWPDLVQRVVGHVCKYEDPSFKSLVYDDILNRVWLPNSPCLVNSGKSNGGLMACFVVGPTEDTLENHFETLKDVATVGKRGGGCGFSGAYIRAEGSPVAGSAHGYAYGPNAWAMIVSDSLDIITQGGFRKMALMYTMPSEHEDLEKFINLKHNGNERYGYNFNQSVFASDEWMKDNILLPEENGLDLVAENAWKNGEPGLLFADTINNKSPYQTCGCRIYATNPCGEQPLPPYGSCNLGSINLAHDVFFHKNGDYNYNALADVVRRMTVFLDDVGSRNIFPNEKFSEWYNNHRPIGIGVMGFADALLRRGIKYGSKKSMRIINEIMSLISVVSYAESAQLGEDRGIPEHCKDVWRRNITTTTIAPTGSIGFIAETSHGIEPVFSPVYQRTDERGEKYLFEHPTKDEDYFVSSLNSDKSKTPTWMEHIQIQAAAQEYVDSGVSKTINMMNGVTKEDVREAMEMAWALGCKGITIYRDGSRNLQVLEDLEEADSLIIDCPSGVCEI